jgi:hypothetical protein
MVVSPFLLADGHNANQLAEDVAAVTLHAAWFVPADPGQPNAPHRYLPTFLMSGKYR